MVGVVGEKLNLPESLRGTCEPRGFLIEGLINKSYCASGSVFYVRSACIENYAIYVIRLCVTSCSFAKLGVDVLLAVRLEL